MLWVGHGILQVWSIRFLSGLTITQLSADKGSFFLNADGMGSNKALGSILRVEKLEIPEGEIFETDKVLLIRTPEQTLIGTPYVTGAKVVAKVLKHGRGEKIIVFKFKPKKRYMRKKGHRQWFTELQIEQIVVPQ